MVVLILALLMQWANADVSPRLAREQAIRSIEECQWSRAIFWARLLDRVDTEFARLYRVAWLQEQRAPLSKGQLELLWGSAGGSEFDREKQWKWGWDGELWGDEKDHWAGINECGEKQRRSEVNHDLSALPEAQLLPLLEPARADYAKLGPLSRKLLRQVALQRRLNGAEFTLPADAGDAEETCALSALRLLEPRDLAYHEAEKILVKCGGAAKPGAADILWANARVRAGDLAAGEGRWKDAFLHYQVAIDLLPERQIPSALWFRFAAASGYSREADDLFVRAVHRVMDEGSGVEPVYQASLRNLFCAEMSKLTPKQSMMIYRKVFNERVLIRNVLALTEGCEAAGGAIWRELLEESKDESDRIGVMGRLLAVALAAGSSQDTKRWASELAAASRKSPFPASRAFWAAVETNAANGAQQAIAPYRAKAEWQKLDESRAARLEARKGETRSDGPLKTEGSAGKPLQLELATRMPPIRFTATVSTDLLAMLKEDARRHE